MRLLKHLVYLFFLLCACARQGMIPNPDRFPPHLMSVKPINRTEISIRFDEELDQTALLPSTFILSSSHDTVGIHFITPDPSDPKTILLFTTPLLDEVYRVKGSVTDRSGNASSVTASFRPSTRRDTLAPYLVLAPLDTVTGFPYTIRLESSEPIDTNRGIATLAAPFPTSESLKTSWERNLSRWSVECRDTTLRGQAFYLVLLPGIYDFAGNNTRYGLATFVYSDTALGLGWVRGNIRTSKEGPARASLVFFKRLGNVFAVTIADSSGTFGTKLATGDSVEVEAWFDREGDGLFEETSSLFFAKLHDSIEITTRGVPTPRQFDQLIPSEE